MKMLSRRMIMKLIASLPAAPIMPAEEVRNVVAKLPSGQGLTKETDDDGILNKVYDALYETHRASNPVTYRKFSVMKSWSDIYKTHQTQEEEKKEKILRDKLNFHKELIVKMLRGKV